MHGMTATAPQNISYYLSFSGEAGSPVGGRYEVNGLPACKFKKELIRVGRFTHPTTGVVFDVSSDTLDKWVVTFAAMSADGIDVPLAASHANTVDESRGYIRDMFREGNSLYGIVECIGEDSLIAAARVNVSIYASNTCVKGNGKSYPWAIQHVAFTNMPVVPGLKPFETLAASSDRDGLTMYTLSLEAGDTAMSDPTLDPAMPEVNPKDAVRKSFKTMMMKLWDDETLDASAFMGKVKELRKKLTDVLVKLGPDELEKEVPKDVLPEGAEVAPPIVASADVLVKKKPDATMVGLLADNRRGKLALSVQAGEITPAASKELEAMFIGDKNEAVVLALSQDAPDMFDAMLNAVKAQGPAVKVGEHSPGQTMALSNPANKGDEENLLVANAKKRKAANEKRSS